MVGSKVLTRLRAMLERWFGRRAADSGHDLHSAHTVLAPAPPGGMRRVLPKRNKRAVEAARSAVVELSVEPPLAASAPPSAPAPAPIAPSPRDRARENMATLLGRGNAGPALAIFVACAKLDRYFVADADTVLPLARQAMAEDKPAVALRVMQRFDVLNPGHADTAGVLLLSAQAMVELGKADAARQLISAFKQYFGKHPLAPEVDALARRLG